MKLGYFTSLTIIAERNSSSTGSANRSLLCEKPFSSIHIKNNVSDATSPAADGIGKPRNSLFAAAAHRRETIEPRQPERAADQINRRDEPADLRMLGKHVRQHDAMHEKRRGHAEGNQVRQRIKFAPERTFAAAHARDAAVEQIKNAREQNENQRAYESCG